MKPFQFDPPMRSTLYFIGVTTAQSSIMKVFSKWADALGIDADIRGIDLPLRPRGCLSHPRSNSSATLITPAAHWSRRASSTSSTPRGTIFGYIDPLSDLMAEVSCISKLDGQVRRHAEVPVTGGLASDAPIIAASRR